jgi:hypothetical protein
MQLQRLELGARCWRELAQACPNCPQLLSFGVTLTHTTHVLVFLYHVVIISLFRVSQMSSKKGYTLMISTQPKHWLPWIT